MKIAVIGDDELSCIKIYEFLKRKTALFVIDQYENGTDFLNNGLRNQYDLVFVDVDPTNIEGLYAAERLRFFSSSVIIVFIASGNFYVHKAFELNAFQYLIKETITEKIISAEYYRAVKEYIDNNEEYILKVRGYYLKTKVNKIVYIESKGRDLCAHLSDSTKLEYKGRLDDETAKLELFGFVRIHKSYLINIRYIERFKSDSLYLYNNDHEFVISRKYRAEIVKKIMAFNKNYMF
ncbi:MAG: LytTR family DNA-binding domain-containing protein [Clostridiales bacterium]|nr:LytTR family DNA-binding domain-containing protein [Clostridiales bacterium]